MRHRTFCLGILLTAVTGLTSIQSARPAIADDVPAWLKQASATMVPDYEKDVPAVVIYDESVVTVSADGHIRTGRNYAVRILKREGSEFAHAVEVYNTGAMGKVLDMKAWLIRPGGSIRKFGKDDAVDQATNDALYNETRTRTISANDVADAGMVFGFETLTEGRPFFSQTVWSFQQRLPSLTSRLTMTLPPGWKAAGIVFNAPAMEPKISGATYTWEMRNLSPIKFEPAGPSVSTLAPRVAVSYNATSGNTAQSSRSFAAWPDVSAWYSELSDVQSEPDDAISQKARELTAGAGTELEKIQAIGRYVQNIHYVSIQIGIGGYRPHSAREVFAKQYGDCKDKANLMRAMLKAINIESYFVLVFSGDRTFVREDWPSPAQFNHCIIAVKLSNTPNVGSVLQHPTLGRFLIFDPTDESTSVGDLPGYEQGSFALVAAGSKGALVKLPANPPESNKRERDIEVSVSSTGAITANVRERSSGQAAAEKRRAFKELSRSQYTKFIEQWAGRDVVGARFVRIEPTDNPIEGQFTLEMGFAADRYAQTMQNRLVVFKPLTLGRDEIPSLGTATRKYPVLLTGGTVVETAHIKFPDGFEIDEIAAPLRISTVYASYTATFAREPGGVLITRTLTQQTAAIPVEGYAELRTFFGRVRAHEEAPIVLARK